MSLIDRLEILVYLLVTLGLAWTVRGARPGAASQGDETAREGFLLAGRRLTLPAFVAALVSSWYGGVLGVGEYSFQHGISNWLVFGVPYYLAAALFALFLAERAQRARVLSLPEQLRQTYGRGPGAIAALVVLATTLPAAYLLTTGVLLQLAFELTLWQGVGLATLFAVACNWRGGLRSVIRSNLLQFVLMYGGFALLVGFLLARHDLVELVRRLPSEHLTWHGGNPPQAIFVWYLIALATLVEPTFYLHCFAARSPATARRGLFLSIGAWFVFDALTTTSGLFARALLVELPVAEATEAFPRLATLILPAGLLGLFFIGLFSTVLSTVDSYLFLSATALGPDLLGARWGQGRPGQPPDRGWSSRTLTRIGLLLAALAAAAIALAARSVVKIWHDFGTIGTCTLLIPAVSSFFPRWRMSSRGAWWFMLILLPVAVLWTFSRHWLPGGGYLLGLEPIYPALGLGFILWGVDRAWMRRGVRTDPGRPPPGSAAARSS